MSITGASMTWAETLDRLLAGTELDAERCRWAMGQVLSGSATEAQIAGFLTAMQSKGVSGSELATLGEVMLEHAVRIEVPGRTVDTCGTGGDYSGSVNISTLAAIVVAACGVPVVKHGNRSASSLAGSADVLEVLGVPVDLAPDLIAQCVDRAGIAFCFARVFHPAMRHAGAVRSQLGIRTVFNLLGPLANPAQPPAQVVGVADSTAAPVVAEALQRRGTAALVVRGEDGLDEITTLSPTRIWDCRGPVVTECLIDTRDLGIARPVPGSLDGGDAEDNARLARATLGSQDSAQLRALRDAVAVNAAAALLVARPRRDATHAASRLVEELAPHLADARAAIAEGAAAATLERWIGVSRELAGLA